jgi:hypothetical protein
LLTGLGLIALGALWLLDAAGVVESGPLISDWWPAALVVVGLSRLLERPPHVSSAVIMTLIGLVLLSFTTGVVDASVLALVWPAALVLLGVWLLFGRRGGDVPGGEDSVSAVALFSGKEVTSDSQEFRGGSLTALFGGIDLDLRRAALPQDGALLDVTAAFGGVDVVVPAGWRVRLHGPVIFGGATDGTAKAGAPTTGPLLDVRVFVLFGGVELEPARLTAGAP